MYEIRKAYRRLDQLNVLIYIEREKCKDDPSRSKKELNSLIREERQLFKKIGEFYEDPITQSISL